MQRREFLATAASAAALPTLLSAKDGKAMIPIVDTHQHLWNLDELKLSWMTPESPLAGNYTPKEYAAAIEGLGVVKSVYMEVDVVDASLQAEADYIIGLCKSGKTTMVAGVVGGRPASQEFPKYAAQFKGSPYIKGIRQCIHVDKTPPGFCLGKEFVKNIKLLGDLGLSYDICIRSGELTDADKLAAECPGTRFILDHCGNAPILDAAKMEVWKKDIASVAGRKNVVCKVSGIVASAKKGEWTAETLAPAVNHTIEAFGWDRVMFAGDWPVCTLSATYKQWVEALQKIVADRPEADRRKLFHDNAVKFYGLG